MSDADDVVALVKAVRSKLVSRPEEIQGAALAEDGAPAIWRLCQVAPNLCKASER